MELESHWEPCLNLSANMYSCHVKRSEVTSSLSLSLFSNVFKEDDISINYRDAEGDLIRLLEDEDVQLMIRESRTQRDRIKRPANQFPWEIHVSATSDLSVYNSEA